MTAAQTGALNAEILRNLSTLAESETMLNRVAKYLRKLVKEREADPTLMTKEEFFARVDEAREEIRQGKAKRFSNPEEMNAWLNSLCPCMTSFTLRKQRRIWPSCVAVNQQPLRKLLNCSTNWYITLRQVQAILNR